MHTALLQAPNISDLDHCRSLSFILEKLNPTLPKGYHRPFSSLDHLLPSFFQAITDLFLNNIEHRFPALHLRAQLG